MTFAPKKDRDKFYRNMTKAFNMAELSGVDTVLISSKGEPMNDFELTNKAIREGSSRFAVELQTNGAALVGNLNKINILYAEGLDVLALSIDRPNDFKKLKPLLVEAERLGLVVRITVVLTDIFDGHGLHWFLDQCREYGVRQLTFRNATVPTTVLATADSHKTREWVEDNTKTNTYDFIMDDLSKNILKSNLVRRLPFGMSVYDLGGVAVTTIDYCIQDSNDGDDIRSLIYHQDGHMYTSWDKPGSILF